MTTDVLDHEDLHWTPHAHIDIFRAVDEREAAFTLYPARARALEKAGLIRKGDKGGLDRSTLDRFQRPGRLLLPSIDKAALLKAGAVIVGERDEPGNLLANAGINRLGALLIGAGGQAYDNGHCAVGAGDTNTAATAADTDLAAAVNASNRWIQDADTSYPTFATQVLTVLATFPTGNANFAWAEWCIAGNTTAAAAAATAPLLNRKVAALGTKTSAAAWAFTVTITIS